MKKKKRICNDQKNIENISQVLAVHIIVFKANIGLYKQTLQIAIHKNWMIGIHSSISSQNKHSITRHRQDSTVLQLLEENAARLLKIVYSILS